MSKDDDVVHCLFRWSQVAYDPSQGDIINGDKLRRDATNAHAELTRLRTENEALREALTLAEAVLSNAPEFETTAGGRIPLTKVSEARDVARAALKESTNG